MNLIHLATLIVLLAGLARPHAEPDRIPPPRVPVPVIPPTLAEPAK